MQFFTGGMLHANSKKERNRERNTSAVDASPLNIYASPSQMESVQILRRSLHRLVHFFRMRPVADARRALPYGLSTDDG